MEVVAKLFHLYDQYGLANVPTALGVATRPPRREGALDNPVTAADTGRMLARHDGLP